MSTQRILVTGINGFVGKHLVRELNSQGIAVVGTATSKPDPEVADLLESFVAADLTNQESVANIDFNGIDTVIHLAAHSHQGMSFDLPQKFIADNSAMVITLFEVILAQKLAKNPRFINVSSGAVYESDQPMPITESSKTTHGSPYAISKLLGEMLGDYYQKRGINTITVRPFNHTGPGQGKGFLLPDMVKQLHELGANGTLQVGNIKTRRDYTDVRDVVKAYVALAIAPEVKNRLYNLCSGTSRSGEEIIDLIAKTLYGDDAKANVEVDQSRIRPNDPPEIFGSTERLQADTGWKQTIPFEQTVRDYVEWFKANPF
ncbi:MAG TPA: GDP-mannose 4,6-dehydratase [Candidatus Saccharimonadales bacterium]|nr:GDP-mannose 4,6-dehydratase [Candidatus Saccharimonadales bacterium]